MSEPQFKIHGPERKKLKTELAQLKLLKKSFWYHHQMEKHIRQMYGHDELLMSKDEAQKKYDQLVQDIADREALLEVPYN